MIAGFPRPCTLPVIDVTVVFDDGSARSRDAQSSWSPHPTLKHREGSDPPVRVEVDAGDVAMEWGDGARFVISEDATTVHVLRPSGMSHDSICTYLVNSVLALCLRRRGTTCLHASAVDIDGEAVAFVASSGSGKSTLAWTLVQRGHTLMTDDVAAVGGTPTQLRPGYPRLRLWPWTVEGLLGDADALPRICDDWEKRSADSAEFDVRERPLAAVVMLDGFGETVALRPLAEPHALAALMRNVSLDKILDTEGRRQDFIALGQIAATVPVLALTRPRDLAAVGASADVVVKWVRDRKEP